MTQSAVSHPGRRPLPLKQINSSRGRDVKTILTSSGGRSQIWGSPETKKGNNHLQSTNRKRRVYNGKVLFNFRKAVDIGISLQVSFVVFICPGWRWLATKPSTGPDQFIRSNIHIKSL